MIKSVFLLAAVVLAAASDNEQLSLNLGLPGSPDEEFHSAAVPGPVPSNLAAETLTLDPEASGYHSSEGIPEAFRIKRAEEAPVSRIVGGLASYVGEHPFFGGLVITLMTGQTSVCGSSLLTANKVLTTAHCWHDGFDTAYAIEVVLGSVRLFSGGTRVYASSVTAHGLYTPGVRTNDIALLTIPAVAFSSAAITQSASLRDVFVAVISNAVCQTYYGGIINSAIICTSGAGGRNPCGGDSGGPLILYSSAGNDVLIGVINFHATSGCSSGAPGGYVRVSYHADWIINNA